MVIWSGSCYADWDTPEGVRAIEAASGCIWPTLRRRIGMRTGWPTSDEGGVVMHQLGWECPKCGSVYAPWVHMCTRCPSSVTTGFTMCRCGSTAGVCPLHGGVVSTGGATV